MTTYIHVKAAMMTVLLLGTMAAAVQAEQWNGPHTPTGAIWRPGSVALGFEPTAGGSKKPLLEIQRPLSGDEDILLSLRSTFRDATATVLQADTKRVYIGGAATRTSLVPDGVFDLAVGRGIAVGVNSVTERLPTDYRLVVGGKVLAEEVRIKLIKDWADSVFQPDYRLAALPEVATYIRDHHHLPEMPSAEDVAETGINLGDMQAKLLRKIEELTLHAIEQHRTIATLQAQLHRLEQDRSSHQMQGQVRAIDSH
ncbi:MAG: hypothetical protein GDA65_01030 [Nitrospira sp. CR1.1]|jgi:hypothetical protein|nr:hypothetical protein [Nitrospira sp. CR1.1]